MWDLIEIEKLIDDGYDDHGHDHALDMNNSLCIAFGVDSCTHNDERILPSTVHTNNNNPASQ